jgi:hypothetical protein
MKTTNELFITIASTEVADTPRDRQINLCIRLLLVLDYYSQTVCNYFPKEIIHIIVNIIFHSEFSKNAIYMYEQNIYPIRTKINIRVDDYEIGWVERLEIGWPDYRSCWVARCITPLTYYSGDRSINYYSDDRIVIEEAFNQCSSFWFPEYINHYDYYCETFVVIGWTTHRQSPDDYQTLEDTISQIIECRNMFVRNELKITNDLKKLMKELDETRKDTIYFTQLRLDQLDDDLACRIPEDERELYLEIKIRTIEDDARTNCPWDYDLTRNLWNNMNFEKNWLNKSESENDL